MRIKYYSENLPKNLFKLIPKKCQNYLDVGCAAGLLGKALKEVNKEAEIIGIEMNSAYAKKAEEYLDRVIIGNVEKLDLTSLGKKFDCIIYGDILEHLYEPRAILEKHKNLLSKDGEIVLSVPNVQFAGVILSLIFGNWNYKDSGILDKTHLRFFTKKTVKKLLKDAGFEIVLIKPNYSNYKTIEIILKSCSLFGILSVYFARQWMIRAVPI